MAKLSPERRQAFERRAKALTDQHDADGLEELYHSEDGRQALMDVAFELSASAEAKGANAGTLPAGFHVNLASLLLRRHINVEAMRRIALADRVKSLQQRLDEVEARLAKDQEKSASTERRLSRHAEHLARLEDRTKRLEGK